MRLFLPDFSDEDLAHRKMDKKYEPLFTPWRIGEVEIKNRIVQCSMGGTSLFGWMEPCHFDQEAAYHILERANENVGLVLPGMQCVRDTLGGRWIYTNKKMFRELAEWLPKFHRTGAKLFVQLSAGFGRSMAVSDLMVKMLQNKALGTAAKPILDMDYLSAAPSPLPNRWAPQVTSRALTIDEIEEIIEAFGKTAKLLQDAGVDGVEVHAVHEGYLIDQFTMANMNHRTDRYGGSFENRYRFPAEIVRCIHRYCGDEFPVSLRYSVVSKTKDFGKGAVPGEEFEEFGRDMEESEKAIHFLEEAGYAMFNCDNGTYDAWYWPHPPVYMPKNCNLTEVEHIKKFTSAPVVCAGKMDPATAAEEIAAGRLDAMGTARQNLTDPKWVTKLMEGREEEIKPCINCHNACFNFSKSLNTANTQDLYDTMHLSRCALNPQTMQHEKYKLVPAKRQKKVAIVGGGVAGMESALVLSQRGHKPVIFEQTDELGGIYRTSSDMSFKEADRKLLAWYELQIKKAGVEVKFHTRVEEPSSLLGEFEEVLICTGAKPKTIPIPGFEMTKPFSYVLAEDAGERVVFLGGGLSACETAYELSLRGKHPVIVEMAKDLITAPGTCLANSSFLRDALAYRKVPVFLNSTITEIRDDGVTIRRKDGKMTNLKCDCVVNAVGFVPAPAAAKGPHIHLVGTCVAWGNLKDVIWNAWDVCMKL